MANTYTLIESQVLGSAAASVTFSAIPATYTDLVLRISARSDRTVSVTQPIRLECQWNWRHFIFVDRINWKTALPLHHPELASTSYIEQAYATAGGATANTYGSAEIYIPSYLASQNKPISGFSNSENNATDASISAVAGLFSSLPLSLQ
jgi:hypothetical protein